MNGDTALVLLSVARAQLAAHAAISLIASPTNNPEVSAKLSEMMTAISDTLDGIKKATDGK